MIRIIVLSLLWIVLAKLWWNSAVTQTPWLHDDRSSSHSLTLVWYRPQFDSGLFDQDRIRSACNRSNPAYLRPPPGDNCTRIITRAYVVIMKLNLQ